MLFSFHFVELAFVPVRPEQQARNPGRRPAHLIADRLQGYIGAALDDEFVMDAPHDETVPEGLHGVCQDVPGHGCTRFSVTFGPQVSSRVHFPRLMPS